MNVTAKQAKDAKRKLPAGWRWVRLLDIVDRITPGKLFDRESCKPEGKVPVVDQSESGFMGFHDEAPGIIASEDLPLVTFANHTCAVRLHTAPFSVIQNVFPLQAREGVDPLFVYWVLSGRLPATFYGGHWPKLVKKEIPLPPLPEQQRIAEVLREQMAAVEKARTAAQARLEAVKALPAAFLRQVLPQPGQSLPDGWRWVKIGGVCERIDYGYTASAAPDIDYPKFLRITDIQDGKVDWLKVPGCDIPAAQELEYELRDGDIVFARTGATTGKSFLLREPPRSVFASYLIRLRAIPQVMMSDFLGAFFHSDGYWVQVSSRVRGGAQGGFNASMLKNLEIPIPLLSEQRWIAAVLKDQMAAAVKARAAAEEELKTINALPATLLRRAFAGEL